MGDSGYANAPTLEVNHEQDEIAHHSSCGQCLDCEEVDGSDGPPMSLQESLPARSFASLGSRLQSRVNQDALDRVSPDIVADVEQSALDARIPPAWVVRGHRADEVGDSAAGSGPPRAPTMASVVLFRHQIAVPTQPRVACDDAGDAVQCRSPQGFARTASLRRWSSVSRRRRLPSCSRSTRFSSTRYSIVFCCPRWIHPATAMTRNCRTGAFTVGSVYGTDGGVGAGFVAVALSRSHRFVRETWLAIRHQTGSASSDIPAWRRPPSRSDVNHGAARSDDRAMTMTSGPVRNA